MNLGIRRTTTVVALNRTIPMTPASSGQTTQVRAIFVRADRSVG